MSENKVVTMGIKDGKFKLSVDPNQDGEEVVGLEISLSEAIQEAVMRGKAVEGAKVVALSFSDGKLNLKLDTDKDGEALLTLTVDLAEVLDELTSK